MGVARAAAHFFGLKLARFMRGRRRRDSNPKGDSVNLKTLLFSIREVELTIAPFVLKSFLPFGFLLVFFLTFDAEAGERKNL